MLDIVGRQGSERGLLFQRAADGAHQRAYTMERWRLIISVALMAGAVAASAVPAVAPPVAIAGAVWAFVSFGLLASISQRSTNTAATIQQQFDLYLFELAWEPYAGQPVPDEELRRWSRRSSLPEDRMRTWYPDVSGLPTPYAILACQRENLTWDWRLRRRYAAVLTACVSAWAGLGVTIALLADLSVRTMSLQWFVPSSSALVMGLQLSSAHRQIANEKEKLATLVRAELEDAEVGGPSEGQIDGVMDWCREVQRGIYTLRRRHERVPRSVYERYRTEDEEDMRSTVLDLQRRLRPDQSD